MGIAFSKLVYLYFVSASAQKRGGTMSADDVDRFKKLMKIPESAVLECPCIGKLIREGDAIPEGSRIVEVDEQILACKMFA